MTHTMHQIDLNASPPPTNDELPFEERVSHIQGVSTSQSIFQMRNMTPNLKYIDLNALPSPDNDDQPLNNTSFSEVTLQETRAKDQGVMRYIDLNALPMLNNDEQPFDNCVDCTQEVHAGAMEAIRISYARYPTRRSFDEFVDRFGMLAPEVLDGSCDEVTATRKLLEKVKLGGYKGKSQMVGDELARHGEQMVQSVEGTRAIALELCREFEDQFLEHIATGKEKW